MVVDKLLAGDGICFKRISVTFVIYVCFMSRDEGSFKTNLLTFSFKMLCLSNRKAIFCTSCIGLFFFLVTCYRLIGFSNI